MGTRLVCVCVVILALVTATTPALAGNNPDVKVAIHVRAHNAKLGCNPGFDRATATCGDLVTTEVSDNFDAFPVFFDLTEYKACSYSLMWPAWTYSAAFTNCAEFVIGGITRPGLDQYAAHSWIECQTGMCVPAFLWLYADGPGTICAIEPGHPDLHLEVLDCVVPFGEPDSPVCSFCAGVYGAVGESPCGPSLSVPSTWGDIRARFGE